MTLPYISLRSHKWKDPSHPLPSDRLISALLSSMSPRGKCSLLLKEGPSPCGSSSNPSSCHQDWLSLPYTVIILSQLNHSIVTLKFSSSSNLKEKYIMSLYKLPGSMFSLHSPSQKNCFKLFLFSTLSAFILFILSSIHSSMAFTSYHSS